MISQKLRFLILSQNSVVLFHTFRKMVVSVHLEFNSFCNQINEQPQFIFRSSFCGSSDGVPADSVVLADCWGQIILAQCQANGMWHSYDSGANASPPSPSLCQFQEVNSPGK